MDVCTVNQQNSLEGLRGQGRCGGGVELPDICHITGYESIVINEVIVQVVENTVLFVYRMIFLFNSEHFN